MASRSRSKKWTEDVGFYEWLVAKSYATKRSKDGSVEVKSFLTLGMVLYMHEAYLAGQNSGCPQQAD